MKQENKGLRVKRKGARAKEKVKRFKRGSKVADSAQGEKMNEVFFFGKYAGGQQTITGRNKRKKRLRGEIKTGRKC